MKGNKLAQLLNARIRVTLLDGRVIIGQLLAHDKHFNLVLCESEEFRLPRSNQNKNKSNNNLDEFRRTLGMIVLRGEEVVAVNGETGAPPKNKARIPASAASASTASASATGFSIPAPGTGLTGPGVRL